MRITHNEKTSYIQGTVAEEAKILKWIKLTGAEIMVDECDEDETSFTVIIPHSTQKERAEEFAWAKKQLAGK